MKHLRKGDFAPRWLDEAEAPVERWPLPAQGIAWLSALALGGYFWYEVLSACF